MRGDDIRELQWRFEMSLSSKLVKHVTYPLWLLKHGEFALLRYGQEFEKLQYLSRERLEELQLRKIKDILIHADKNSRFYNQLFKRSGVSVEAVRNLDDFTKIPTISKQDIRENLPLFLTQSFDANELLQSNTGGSTGTPLTFYRDKRCFLYREAIDIVFNRWLGFEIGDWAGLAWGAGQDVMKNQSLKVKLATLLLHRTFFLSYEHITPQSIEAFIGRIKIKKPKLVIAYPNMIYQVARYLTDKKIDDVFVPSIVCTAEALFPHQRKLIEVAFHCKVFERYGSREVGTVASECKYHKGMHIFSPSVYLEIIKDGKRTKPGEIGEIVITDLLNYGMPFIRYQVGDMGALGDRECECGRKLPLLEKVLGRTTDAVITSDGTIFAGQALISIIRRGDVPARVQIVQEEKNHLIVKIVKQKGFEQKHIDYLREELRKSLGQSMNVTCKYVNDIPREASGKYRYIISKVPIKFI